MVPLELLELLLSIFDFLVDFIAFIGRVRIAPITPFIPNVVTHRARQLIICGQVHTPRIDGALRVFPGLFWEFLLVSFIDFFAKFLLGFAHAPDIPIKPYIVANRA